MEERSAVGSVVEGGASSGYGTGSASGGDGGTGTGGSGAYLLCKTLVVEQKVFYFDLKENPRGRYLKISEKTAASRTIIVVPLSGISRFLDLFNYYVTSDDQELLSKELHLDTKAFFFDIGVNRWGRFLKVSEISMHRNPSTIVIPAGNSRDEGWTAFRNILAEIKEDRRFVLPNQQSAELAGLSDDVDASVISGPSNQPESTTSELNVETSVDLPELEETGKMDVSKVVRVDKKKFFFDLGTSNRGHFLRISEVTACDRSSIVLPLSGLKQFHEILGHFDEITKDRPERLIGTYVRKENSPER